MNPDSRASTAVASITDRLRGSPGPSLLLAGAVLFVIPEPITSVLGALVFAVGLLVLLGGAVLD